MLAQLAAKYDYEAIGRGRLTNDALIAVEAAARMKIKVITTNARRLRTLSRILRASVATRYMKAESYTIPFLNSSRGYFVPRQMIPSFRRVWTMESSSV